MISDDLFDFDRFHSRKLVDFNLVSFKSRKPAFTGKLKAAACCIITYYTHRKEDPLSINYLQKLGLLYKNTFPCQLFLKLVFKNCSHNKLLSLTYFSFISFFEKVLKIKVILKNIWKYKNTNTGQLCFRLSLNFMDQILIFVPNWV